MGSVYNKWLTFEWPLEIPKLRILNIKNRKAKLFKQKKQKPMSLDVQRKYILDLQKKRFLCKYSIYDNEVIHSHNCYKRWTNF